MDVDGEQPTSSLRLDTVSGGASSVVIVRGAVDAATAPQLAAVVEGMLPDVVTELELDLTELTFLDSSGLAVVAEAIRKLQQVNGVLSLRNTPPLVHELLRITDLLRFVTLVGDEGAGA